jgi:hypothetical protein
MLKLVVCPDNFMQQYGLRYRADSYSVKGHLGIDLMDASLGD